MALQLEYSAPFRVTFATAYLRVVKVDLDAVRCRGMIEYWVYPSATVRGEDQQATIQRKALPIYEPAYSLHFGTKALAAEGADPFSAAYAYFKTLGSLSLATDC